MFLEHFLWGKGIRGTEIKEYRSKEVQEYRHLPCRIKQSYCLYS